MNTFARARICLLSLLVAVSVVNHAQADRPNIVVILVDDMGYSDIGCYGGEIQTPNIDALADGGLRFRQFYNTAKCYTTRASLLTGLYHHQALDGKVLNRKCATIAEVLKPTGYRTLMSGKWHLNGPELDNTKFQPLARGFDEFFGTIIGANSYFEPYTLQRGNKRIEPDEDFYYTDAITDDAVAKIAKHAPAKTPFFHYVTYTAPHWPMHIPPNDPAVDKYKKIYAQGWDAIRQARLQRQKEMGLLDSKTTLSARSSRVDEWRSTKDRRWEIHRMAVYAAMVESLDRGIGRIVSQLNKSGELENSLIVFMSDNGGSPEYIGFNNGLNTLGKKQTTRDGKPIQIGGDPTVFPGGPTTYQGVGVGWANVNNTPFREFKTFSHEGGIRTPMIVHWPKGVANPGKITGQVGHLIDIMPTCLELAGVEYPKTLNGRAIIPCEGESLVDCLRGGPVKERVLYWDFANHVAVRQGKWKLAALSARDQNWEMYDIEKDPTELNDLFDLKNGQAMQLAFAFDYWLEHVGGVALNERTKKPNSNASRSEPKQLP